MPEGKEKMIKRIETNADGKAFCVLYKSGCERYFTERTLPKSAYNFMVASVKSGRCGKCVDPITEKELLYCY